MAHLVHHAAHLRRILLGHAVANTAEPQRAKRVNLALVGAIAALALRDDEVAHVAASGSSPVPAPASAGARVLGPSSASGSLSGAAAGVGSAPFAASGAPDDGSDVGPRTWLMLNPRSWATSSGVRSASSPAMVAFTRLIGFCEPSDLERMSWIPASSSTARTPPPAMTPVPGDAGLRNTRPDPNTPVTWCVIVEPCLGTR